MKLPDIEDLSDKSLWVIAIILSCSSLLAALPIWMLLRKRKKENEGERPVEEEKEENDT